MSSQSSLPFIQDGPPPLSMQCVKCCVDIWMSIRVLPRLLKVIFKDDWLILAYRLWWFPLISNIVSAIDKSQQYLIILICRLLLRDGLLYDPCWMIYMELEARKWILSYVKKTNKQNIKKCRLLGMSNDVTIIS